MTLTLWTITGRTSLTWPALTWATLAWAALSLPLMLAWHARLCGARLAELATRLRPTFGRAWAALARTPLAWTALPKRTPLTWAALTRAALPRAALPLRAITRRAALPLVHA